MKHVKSITASPRAASNDIGIGAILGVIGQIIGVLAAALIQKEGGTTAV